MEEFEIWIYFWLTPFMLLAFFRIIYLIIKYYKKNKRN